MTDVKRLLAAATPLPWIRPWADLTVHAPGRDDLFGRLVPSIHHPGSLEAQANIDLAVHAVNRLPDYEAAVDALERLLERIEHADKSGGLCDDHFEDSRAAAAALRRLRDEVLA